MVCSGEPKQDSGVDPHNGLHGPSVARSYIGAKVAFIRNRRIIRGHVVERKGASEWVIRYKYRRAFKHEVVRSEELLERMIESTHFEVDARVEVLFDGVWYPATLVRILAGRKYPYEAKCDVDRDNNDVTSVARDSIRMLSSSSVRKRRCSLSKSSPELSSLSGRSSSNSSCSNTSSLRSLAAPQVAEPEASSLAKLFQKQSKMRESTPVPPSCPRGQSPRPVQRGGTSTNTKEKLPFVAKTRKSLVRLALINSVSDNTVDTTTAAEATARSEPTSQDRAKMQPKSPPKRATKTTQKVAPRRKNKRKKPAGVARVPVERPRKRPQKRLLVTKPKRTVDREDTGADTATAVAALPMSPVLDKRTPSKSSRPIIRIPRKTPTKSAPLPDPSSGRLASPPNMWSRQSETPRRIPLRHQVSWRSAQPLPHSSYSPPHPPHLSPHLSPHSSYSPRPPHKILPSNNSRMSRGRRGRTFTRSGTLHMDPRPIYPCPTPAPPRVIQQDHPPPIPPKAEPAPPPRSGVGAFAYHHNDAYDEELEKAEGKVVVNSPACVGRVCRTFAPPNVAPSSPDFERLAVLEWFVETEVGSRVFHKYKPFDASLEFWTMPVSALRWLSIGAFDASQGGHRLGYVEHDEMMAWCRARKGQKLPEIRY